MHIENFPNAYALASESHDLQQACKNAHFPISIGTRFKDDEMIAAIQSAVAAGMMRRIAVINEELVAMGVTFD